MNDERKGQIALSLCRFLNGEGRTFKAYEDDVTANIYFRHVTMIDRSALHSFHDTIASSPGLLEQSGRIAYAVLKFDVAFNRLDLDGEPFIATDPVEFADFVSGMQDDIHREIELMAAFG